MLNIALIGCTGSIGRQVASVVRRDPQRFRFSALCAGHDGEGLLSLCREFRPEFAALAAGDPGRAGDVPQGTHFLRGAEIAEHIFEGCDVAFIAAGGFAGLAYTLRAAETCRRIALANKESLVCGGQLVMDAIARTGAELIPVDSEHSAIFQALSFHRHAPFSRIVLTASGGPFRTWPKERLRSVTARDALRHPTWKMGDKITVDSATLLNKGYEVIEAKWLFGAPFEAITAVVHPESIVHSLVCFADGAALAQLGYPTMEVPIQLALTCPERLPCAPQLDLTAIKSLTFERLREEDFPCFGLAVGAGKAGGTLPTVLNAAAEEAVRAFLAERISFFGIAETISETLSRIPREEASCFAQLQEADMRARRTARKLLYDV